MIPASALTDFFADNPLNYIYAGALLIGAVYAAFLLFFQGIGDVLGDLDFNVDIDMDGDLDFSSDGATEATGISMLAIASFISSFGAFGLLASSMEGGIAVSLLSALFGGLIIGIAAQVFFMYILSPTISSEVNQTRLIGMVAEITTPIPEQGVGQIALVAQGSRMTYSARAITESEAVPRGTPVRIERIVGGMAYVTKLD
jgi:membrane protein implicated in regulation of membrane protease activity